MYFQHKMPPGSQERGVACWRWEEKPGCPWVLVSESQHGRMSGLFWTRWLKGVGRRGVPAAKAGAEGRRAAPARPFQGGLMHQTSIFRTIELVIFFLLN